MKRATPGTGSVYLMKSRPGTWCGSTSVAGKKYRVYGKTKKGTRAKLSKLIAEGPPKKRVVPTLTVRVLLDEWLTRDVAGRDSAPSTIARHRWAADLWTSEIGVRRVADLSTREVEEALEALEAKPLSKASLRQALSTLIQALKYAERHDDVTRNVARLAGIPVRARDAKDRTSLTRGEAATLAAVLDGERNGGMFLLSLRVGLRPGEAAALYWEDIDLAAGTVNVTRGMQTADGKRVVVDELKTTSAKRTLAVPVDVVAALKAHRAMQRNERLAAEAWADDRLVFASKIGTALDAANTRRELARICSAAGVPSVLPNELRHTCTSLLADAGTAHESIAQLLGHSTTRMVETVYKHRVRPVIDVAVNS